MPKKKLCVGFALTMIRLRINWHASVSDKTFKSIDLYMCRQFAYKNTKIRNKTHKTCQTHTKKRKLKEQERDTKELATRGWNGRLI